MRRKKGTQEPQEFVGGTARVVDPFHFYLYFGSRGHNPFCFVAVAQLN